MLCFQYLSCLFSFLKNAGINIAEIGSAVVHCLGINIRNMLAHLVLEKS
jgi:hypothetical protein